MLHSWVKPSIRGAKFVATMGDSGDSRFWGFITIAAFFLGTSRAIIGRNEKTRWFDIVAAGVVSTGCGLGVGCLALYCWGPERQLLIMAICSLASYMGLALMDTLASLATSLLKQRAAQLTKQDGDKRDLSGLFSKPPKD